MVDHAALKIIGWGGGGDGNGMRQKLGCAKNWRARRVTVCLQSEKCRSDPTESEMENDGSRIPKLRKIDANAGARKGTSALNTVLKVLRIADLISLS
jgi:hypothetical protein